MLARPRPDAGENRLLAALPPAVFKRLASGLEKVRLDEGRTLLDIADRSDQAWFITGGVVSLLSATTDGDTIELAMVGREGVVGLPGVARNNESPFRAHVQIQGEALRVSAAALRAAFRQGGELQELLFDYSQAMISQVAQTMTCHLFHRLDQRLARWLLMAHDRVLSDTFVLTHESLAQTFGVSRSGVSSAAGALRKRGLFDYLRGRITIRDREGLEDAACECYQAISQAMNNFLPPEVGQPLTESAAHRVKH
jgi:CRP-like cAMP-binding protein